jgi:hypothetical protein
VHCFSRSVDSHLCFSAMNPVFRPVFVTYVRVQAHMPSDDEYRARFRCSFTAKANRRLKRVNSDFTNSCGAARRHGMQASSLI